MVTLSDQVATDLSTLFFSGEDLNILIAITKAGGGVLSDIPAHFEKDWVSAGAAEWSTDIGAPQEIFVPHPAAFVNDADIPGIAKGDTVAIPDDTTVYEIRELQPDGTGVTEIVLWQP